MDHTTPLSVNTKLKNRTLWYDGDSSVCSEDLITVLTTGIPVSHVFVDALSDEVVQYNKFAASPDKLRIKTELKPLTNEWVDLPPVDVEVHVHSCLEKELNTANLTPSQVNARRARVLMEMSMYTEMGLCGVLQALIYTINTFRTNRVVWGVGRGSSVSSYVLYLIGVHDIDSVEYDLNITDFLRIQEK